MPGIQRIPQVDDRVWVAGSMNGPDPVAVGAAVQRIPKVGDRVRVTSHPSGRGRTLDLIDGDPFVLL